jgi:predicted peptidase
VPSLPLVRTLLPSLLLCCAVALGAEQKALRFEGVYVTGLPAGGGGVWALLLQEPERFAAAIPICGAGSRAGIQRLVDLPIWVFHGEEDPAQPLEESTRLVEAIRAKGGSKVKLTVYPGGGHDAWTQTYDDPAVWAWLFAQRRGVSTGGVDP